MLQPLNFLDFLNWRINLVGEAVVWYAEAALVGRNYSPQGLQRQAQVAGCSGGGDGGSKVRDQA